MDYNHGDRRRILFLSLSIFFPDSVLIYKNKCDLQIKLQLIGGFSQVKLRKIFSVKKCLNQLSVLGKDLKKPADLLAF